MAQPLVFDRVSGRGAGSGLVVGRAGAWAQRGVVGPGLHQAGVGLQPGARGLNVLVGFPALGQSGAGSI